MESVRYWGGSRDSPGGEGGHYRGTDGGGNGKGEGRGVSPKKGDLLSIHMDGHPASWNVSYDLD